VARADARTCRSNVELDEDDCDLATGLGLGRGDAVSKSVLTSEGAGGPSVTWNVTIAGALCVGSLSLSRTASKGRLG